MDRQIGDKVRYSGPKGYTRDLTVGNVYEVVYTSHATFAVRDDAGDENWQLNEDNSTPVSDSEELEMLRTFKARALARFPALATPETADEAAERIAEEAFGYLEAAREGIAWGRANPA